MEYLVNTQSLAVSQAVSHWRSQISTRIGGLIAVQLQTHVPLTQRNLFLFSDVEESSGIEDEASRVVALKG